MTSSSSLSSSSSSSSLLRWPCDTVLVVLLSAFAASVQVQRRDYPSSLMMQDSVDPVQSVCEKDSFEANCLQDEAIVVTYARYGRMRITDCITSAYGTIGCSTDVQTVLESLCSGRRHCEVNVASSMRTVRDPCSNDLRSYLEVSYRCVKVAFAEKSTCHSSGAIELRQPRGYLSSLIADEQGCGTNDSPWWLAASPGQRIRLTLLDFGLLRPGGHGQSSSSSTSSSSSGGYHQPTCLVYAVVREVELPRSETICGGGALSPSVRVIYTSTGRLVEVRFTRKQLGGGRPGHFLINYEAIGCPHPVVPRGGWMVKTDRGYSMGCNNSQANDARIYHISCQGTAWHGTAPNCTEETEDMTLGWTTAGQTSVASLALVMCIAAIVGIIILGSGLFYLRRRDSRPNRLAQPRALNLRDPKAPVPEDTGAYDLAGQYVVDGGGGGGGCSTNDYFHGGGGGGEDRSGSTRPSTGGGGDPGLASYQYDSAATMMLPSYDPTTRGCTLDDYDHQQVRYVEHIYDSPQFNRREKPPGGDGTAMRASPSGETTTTTATEQLLLPVVAGLPAFENDCPTDFRNALY